MNTPTILTSKSMIRAVGLTVLAAFLSTARPALAQTQAPCPLPPGVTPPPDPRVTAQQVEDGSASLMEFAVAVRDQLTQTVVTGAEEAVYIGCLIKQEGGPYHSGSTYIVQLTPDRIFMHGKSMALSGRLLDPRIYEAILEALGIDPADLADPVAALAAFRAAADGDGGMFNVPDIPGASGYAITYVGVNLGLPIVLLAGFDLDETHVAEEDIDHGNPTVTAGDVVDRTTLKTFVTEAGEYWLQHQTTGDLADSSRARIALRNPDGPWRQGSVYLYVLDTVSNIITFHAAFPDRFELKPLIPTVRDVVTGELILPQVIEAAKSDPEGGFLEYYFDDPNDDTDSADIPKVGYARQFTGEIPLLGRVIPVNFIIGSGYYQDSFAPLPSTKLVNISARAFVGTGEEVLISGFIIGGDGEQEVLVQALGPELANDGIFNPLADPVLTVTTPDGMVLMENDNWEDSQRQRVIDAWGGSPNLAAGSASSAAILTLGPGSYTAKVEGKDGTTGVAIVEVYDIN